MPIEFPCQQCGQTLRVPDEAAGKMARCPKCSFVSKAPEALGPVPTSSTPPPSTYPPPADPNAAGRTAAGPSTTENPFAAGANPFRDDPDTSPPGAANPYQSPASSSVTSRYTLSMIRNKVQGPAIALIVIGSLNVLWLGLFIVGFVGQVITGAMREEEMVMSAVFLPLFLIKSVPVIYGGLQMMKLRNYAAAMTATVITFLPCCYCYIIELPIAIWAVVVLSDYHVRAAFQQGPAAGNPMHRR